MNDYTPTPSPKGRPSPRAIKYLYALFAATALCIITGVACSLLSLDAETRYFASEYASIAVLAAAALCIVLSIAAFPCISRDEASTAGIGQSKARYLIIPELFTMLACIRLIWDTVGAKIIAAAHSGAKNSSLTIIALTLLLIAFALSFLYSCRFAYKNPSNVFVAVMGICRIVFFLYIITTLYFDMVVELNSPFKLIVQFTAAAGALQTCAEVRGTVSGISERAYVAAKALSMGFGALCFTLICGAVIKGISLPDNSYICYSAFFLASNVFSAYEIIRIGKKPLPVTQDLEERNDEI